MKKLAKNSGITLIALVITIIVLLILAGVTIMSVTGENGILSRSISAREKTKEAQALEELKEKIMEVQIDKKGEATLQDIIDALQSDTENSYTVSTELATITGTLPDLDNKTELYILYKDYWFKINSKLEVSFVKDSESNENNESSKDDKEDEEDEEPLIQEIGSTTEFKYTGSYQEYEVKDTGYYKMECWGASGGRCIIFENYQDSYGTGGYSAGTIKLSKR